MPKFNADVELLRTSFLYEADVSADALETAGIPYYRAEENMGGLQSAMPVLAAQGPGANFLVFIPAAMEKEGRAILEGLPIAPPKDSEVFGFTSSDSVKKSFKVYFVIILVLFLIYIVSLLIKFMFIL